MLLPQQPGRIAFAPEHAPGTLGWTSAGLQLRYVAPAEYYGTKLWHTYNVVQVFMEMAFALAGDPAEALVVENAVASAYWGRHQGVLLPPRLVRQLALLSAQSGGMRLLSWTETWLDDIGRAPSYGVALTAHATARATILRATSGVVGLATHVATAEIVADLLLVQRAIRDDVETAERESAGQQLRGTLLTEMDRDERLLFERALDHVLSSERMFESLPRDAQLLARQYAPYRGDLDQRGVLAAPGV